MSDNNQWFGYWKEMGTAYALCPSVLEYVEEPWNADWRERVLAYLLTSPIIAVTSRIAFPCVFHGLNCPALHSEPATLAARSDGVWNWSPDLPHYIEHHAVRIPDAMFAHMQECGFQPPRNVAETVFPLSGPPFIEDAGHIPQVLFPLPSAQQIDTIIARAEQHFRSREYRSAVTMFLQVEEHLTVVQQQKLLYAQSRMD